MVFLVCMFKIFRGTSLQGDPTFRRIKETSKFSQGDILFNLTCLIILFYCIKGAAFMD